MEKSIVNAFKKYERFIVATHVNPDPDAVGSALAMALFLRAKGKKVRGYEVDDAARKHIEKKKFGKFFIHRTGHSIGEEVHGNGANMDNLETHDERLIMPMSSFSIEPGLYFKGKWGLRTEIDVYISDKMEVIVTGGKPQEKIVAILP